LKPKQSIFADVGTFSDLEPKNFTVTTSWTRQRGSKAREQLSYDMDLNYFRKMGRLGGDPFVDIANATKKIADNVSGIASGSSRMKIDAYSSVDRAEERREHEEWRERQRAEQQARVGAPAPADVPPTEAG